MIDIDGIIRGNAYIYGILNLLIGGFIGHNLSIIRDKRKEFNEIAFSIRQELERQLDLIKENEDGSRGIPKKVSKEKFIALELKICLRKKNKFSKAVSDYYACFVPNRYPDCNGYYYDVIIDDDYENLDRCIKSLIKFCKLK